MTTNEKVIKALRTAPSLKDIADDAYSDEIALFIQHWKDRYKEKKMKRYARQDITSVFERYVEVTKETNEFFLATDKARYLLSVACFEKWLNTYDWGCDQFFALRGASAPSRTTA